MDWEEEFKPFSPKGIAVILVGAFAGFIVAFLLVSSGLFIGVEGELPGGNRTIIIGPEVQPATVAAGGAEVTTRKTYSEPFSNQRVRILITYTAARQESLQANDVDLFIYNITSPGQNQPPIANKTGVDDGRIVYDSMIHGPVPQLTGFYRIEVVGVNGVAADYNFEICRNPVSGQCGLA